MDLLPNNVFFTSPVSWKASPASRVHTNYCYGRQLGADSRFEPSGALSTAPRPVLRSPSVTTTMCRGRLTESIIHGSACRVSLGYEAPSQVAHQGLPHAGGGMLDRRNGSSGALVAAQMSPSYSAANINVLPAGRQPSPTEMRVSRGFTSSG